MSNTAVLRERRNAFCRRLGERGAVALEFALILPVLVMLLLGVTTAGLAYSDHLAVTNAVREGARLGSAIDYATSPTTPDIWASTVQNRVQQAYYNAGSALTTSQVCVKLVDSANVALAPTSALPPGCTGEPALPSNVVTGSCVVKVWVAKPGSIRLGVFPDLGFTIRARSVSYYGRAAGACSTP